MSNSFLLLSPVLLLVVFAVALTASASRADFCSDEEEIKAPCRCCKMRCWYNVQQQAFSILGHMPGKNDDSESVDALFMIKSCVQSQCADACVHSKRAFPFRHAELPE